MTLFPETFVESPGEGGRWPAPLMGADGEALRQRIDLAASSLPPAVAAVVGEMLTGDQALMGRASLQVLCLAGAHGARPLQPIEPRLILMERADGQQFVLGTLAFSQPESPMGPPASVQGLIEALDGAFGPDRRYTLYLRRPVPEDLDPEPIVRSVRLWLVAVERGEWQGKHAVYEDDDIAVEITLLDPRDGQHGLSFLVGPTTSLERMAAVDSSLVELVAQHEQLAPEHPLVVALAADTRWRMPRGYVEQLLYGTADWVSARADTYIAAFQPTGLSLFSDAACSKLAALWWLEPAAGDPLAFHTWAHENPWCEDGGLVPAISGRRFSLAGPTDLDTPGSGNPDQIVLTWIGGDVGYWGP